MGEITAAYHSWRGEPDAATYKDVPGFCASATPSHFSQHRFVLTPGRYVGTEDAEDDGEPIEREDRSAEGELFVAFEESDRLASTCPHFTEVSR